MMTIDIYIISVVRIIFVFFNQMISAVLLYISIIENATKYLNFSYTKHKTTNKYNEIIKMNAYKKVNKG